MITSNSTTTRTPLKNAMTLLRSEAGIAREFLEDWRRYRKHTAHEDAYYFRNTADKHLEAQVTKDYHRIEKGLALSDPKRPFGNEVANRLKALIPLIGQAPEPPYARYAKEALDALAQWNETGTVDSIVSPQATQMEWLDKKELKKFFGSRRSVRHFSGKPLEVETLLEAVELASFTPSVCNRQSTRVHLYTNPIDVETVLSHQNGNAGFRHQVPAVAVITTDRRLFSGRTERNQRWIDGGLYAMSFAWALHGLGISTCMLNWSVTNKQSDSLRTAAGIEDWEDIVVLIACGDAAPGHRYARSPKRDPQDVVQIH